MNSVARGSTPSLVLLAGPSHAGKTTLAQKVHGLYPSVSAMVGLDSFLPDSIYLDERIVRSAYEKLFSQIEQSSEAILIVEATFTLVQRSGVCTTFNDLYTKLLKHARFLGRTMIATFVDVKSKEAVRRAEASGRLPLKLVAQIWRCSQAFRRENRGMTTLPGNDQDRAVRIIMDLLSKTDSSQFRL